MEHLPPTGWADVATKRDVDGVRIELRGEMSELRGEFAHLRGEMRAGFAEVRGEMAELRGELHHHIARQTRMFVITAFGMMATSIGGTISVAALAH
jgi:hypothetical protein